MQKYDVLLRPFTYDDAPQLASMANNKNVWDNLRDYIPHPYSESDAIEFIMFCETNNPQSHFAIEYKGVVVGTASLIQQKDVYSKSAEIGYWIGESYWKKGIGTIAVDLLCAYGFETFNVNRMYASVFSYNSASMKVLERNGFEKEGVFKQAVYKNESLHDEVRYGKVLKV